MLFPLSCLGFGCNFAAIVSILRPGGQKEKDHNSRLPGRDINRSTPNPEDSGKPQSCRANTPACRGLTEGCAQNESGSVRLWVFRFSRDTCWAANVLCSPSLLSVPDVSSGRDLAPPPVQSPQGAAMQVCAQLPKPCPCHSWTCWALTAPPLPSSAAGLHPTHP